MRSNILSLAVSTFIVYVILSGKFFLYKKKKVILNLVYEAVNKVLFHIYLDHLIYFGRLVVLNFDKENEVVHLYLGFDNVITGQTFVLCIFFLRKTVIS